MYAQNHNPLNFPSMHKPMCVEEMAGYDLTYTYQDSTGHKFQLANVQDVNYRTEGTAGENDKVNNGHRYTYDANGNLVYINTSRVKKDGKEDEKATEQKYRWDEENRLLAADENGFVSNYWYDADGERTVKTSGEGEQIYVNSEFAGGRTNTAKFSLYVSPYLVANQGGRYTKHIYIGSQRIVSKLGDFASYGSDPRRIPYAGSEADAINIDYKGKYGAQQQVIKDNYATFNVPYNGEDNNDYVNGEGFCCNDGTPEAAQAKAMAANTAGAKANNFHDADSYEKMQFYYHPDHLGSSSYITNLDGEVSQHIEYVPFGEVFIEERNNTWNTPYLFNAKEFDEETGLYYYGARYYEPRLSLWMSTDPLQEKYINVSTYCYVLNNPVKLIDPNGKIPIETIWDIGNVIYDFGAAVINHIKGNHKAAFSNWGDLGLDAAAVFIHYVPAGASKALKVADKTVDVLKGFKPLAKVSAGGKNFSKMEDFYKSVRKLAPGQRVAKYKGMGENVAKNNKWKRDVNLSKKNGRSIYTDSKGNHYSLDTHHGEFEVLDKRGKHQGAVNFNGERTKKPNSSGKHNIKI